MKSTKLLDFRKGTSQMRHERAKWKRWHARGLMPHMDSRPEPIEPVEHDTAEPFSELDITIETGPNGSVSCSL